MFSVQSKIIMTNSSTSGLRAKSIYYGGKTLRKEDNFFSFT
jgi:hypothetical protein